jgi:DNA-binding NtrC family response regulator
MTSRPRESIVVCGPRTGHTEGVAGLLSEQGWDVTLCSGGEALLALVCEHRPRAIVYALAHQLAVDLALLVLLSRVAPGLPVVVVASAEQGARAGRLDAAHPVVLENSPADGLRLRHALRAALRRPRKRAPALVEATG